MARMAVELRKKLMKRALNVAEEHEHMSSVATELGIHGGTLTKWAARYKRWGEKFHEAMERGRDKIHAERLTTARALSTTGLESKEVRETWTRIDGEMVCTKRVIVTRQVIDVRVLLRALAKHDRSWGPQGSAEALEAPQETMATAVLRLANEAEERKAAQRATETEESTTGKPQAHRPKATPWQPSIVNPG